MDRIYLSPPDVSPLEKQAVLNAIESNWIAPIGPDLDQFEIEISKWTGMPLGVGLSSGTAALHFTLLLSGVGPGDEVLVPTLTFVPTANAARYVGARPFFVDCETESWGLDPELLTTVLRDRARRDSLPRAAMVVDLYGQCADYKNLLPVFEEYGIPVIEDAAEALGASRDGRPAGSFGSLSAISFNGNKIITASSGGMLMCRDADTASLARKLATQARDNAPHYEHSMVGYNYRLSNILAAFGRAQLATLEERIARRKEIRSRYAEALGPIEGVSLSPIAMDSEPNCWLTCITVDPTVIGIDTGHLRQKLEEENIETRPVWKPMHLQPLYSNSERYLNGNAERLFKTGLCLPSGSSMSDDDLERVIENLITIFRG